MKYILAAALLAAFSNLACAQPAYIVQPAIVKYAQRGMELPWYLYEEPQPPCWAGGKCVMFFESYDGLEVCRRALGNGTPPPPDGEPDWCNYGVPKITYSGLYLTKGSTAYGDTALCVYYELIEARLPTCYSQGDRTSGWRYIGLYAIATCPDATWTRSLDLCYKLLPNPDSEDCPEGNPVEPATAAKLQYEVDAVFPDVGTVVALRRTFSSRSLDKQGRMFGVGWRLMPYERKLQFIRGYWDPTHVIAVRTANSTVTIGRPTAGFAETGIGWTQPPGRPGVLISRRSSGGVSTEWTIRDEAEGTYEVYSADGRLAYIQHANGRLESLVYSAEAAPPNSVTPRPGLLIAIQFSSGRNIEFTYSSLGQIVRAEIPARAPAASLTVDYTYQSGVSPLLLTRTIAGTTRSYAYEDQFNPSQTPPPAWLSQVIPQPTWGLSPQGPWCAGSCSLPNNMQTFDSWSAMTAPRSPVSITGVIDEKGDRMSTFSYDTLGRAISTERAGGAGKFQFSYPTADSVAITDPLGTVRTRQYQTINGVVHPSSVPTSVIGERAVGRRLAPAVVEQAVDLLGLSRT